jgi:hypothetical protein
VPRLDALVHNVLEDLRDVVHVVVDAFDLDAISVVRFTIGAEQEHRFNNLRVLDLFDLVNFSLLPYSLTY